MAIDRRWGEQSFSSALRCRPDGSPGLRATAALKEMALWRLWVAFPYAPSEMLTLGGF